MVQVPTSFLVKTVNSGKNPVEWTIKFNPFDLQALKNVKITDQIPEGLEFSLKQDGSLDLTSFKVTEYDSMVSGAFPTFGGTELDKEQLQSMISYEKASRVLTFTPAEGKLYQIIYQTEVTGNVSGNLKNWVIVSGSSIDDTGTNSSYAVQNSHAKATLVRNGYLDISKVDEQSHPLSGAVFTLYSDQALQNPIRVSSLRLDGTLRIVPIPAPKNLGDPEFTYYLKETTVPDGVSYRISEADSSDGYLTSSTGESGSIVAGQTKTAAFTNTKLLPGSLAVKKTVDGNAEEDIAFDFTVIFTKLDGTPDNGLYDYSGPNGTGKINSGDKFSLAHNQSIIITNQKTVAGNAEEDRFHCNAYKTGWYAG